MSDVLDCLASGMSEQAILQDFPDLTSQDIRAYLAFAADRERRLMAFGVWTFATMLMDDEMKTVQVSIDADLVAVLEEVGRPAKDSVGGLIVLELYREGLISSGKAAELMGLAREEFIRRAGEQGIPYIQMSREELRSEIERAKTI